MGHLPPSDEVASRHDSDARPHGHDQTGVACTTSSDGNSVIIIGNTSWFKICEPTLEGGGCRAASM